MILEYFITMHFKKKQFCKSERIGEHDYLQNLNLGKTTYLVVFITFWDDKKYYISFLLRDLLFLF